MPVISFWGNSEKETGQTLSTIATSTMMAIEHNYKTLAITTGFKDKTIGESFFVPGQIQNIQKIIGVQNNNNVIESGVEGLNRLVQSNIVRKGLAENYVKVVLRDRYDILESPKTEVPKEYLEIAKNYPAIIGLAKLDYNLIFVDIDKRMPGEIQKELLVNSDIIIVNISQGKSSLDRFSELLEVNDIFKGNNILLQVGKYDRYSKYNVKNISRNFKGKVLVSAVPYNTLFFESSTEGKVADYFLRYRNIQDKTDRNSIFLDETKKTCDNIVLKLQELSIRG